MSQAHVYTPAKSLQKNSRINGSNVLVAASTLALIVIGALTVRLAVGSLALTTRERAIQAEQDRWTGLANYYSEQAASRARVIGAESARWAGLAGHYEEQTAQRQRALAADTARWTALAEWYSGQSVGASPAQTAYAAHYTGLALAEFARTGDPSLLPNCVSPELAAQLPIIGGDSWRTEVPACGE